MNHASIIKLPGRSISVVPGASLALLAIFHVVFPYIYITTTEDVEVVARGNITIVVVSDVDGAIRPDAHAFAMEFVGLVALTE